MVTGIEGMELFNPLRCPVCRRIFPTRRNCSIHVAFARRRGGCVDNAAECGFAGCGKAAFAKGLCPAHYAQQRRGLELRPLNMNYSHPGPREPRDSPS